LAFAGLGDDAISGQRWFVCGAGSTLGVVGALAMGRYRRWADVISRAASVDEK
jgi:hypothetical protein